MPFEQPNLPKQEELNQLYGSWNPMSYMQGQLNQDLASQFREQASRANAQSSMTAKQTYDQAELTNPLAVERMKWENLKGTADAGSAVLKTERETAQRQNNLNADERAAVMKMSEDDVKLFGDKATQMSISEDPAVRAKGIKMLEWLPAMTAERRKQADALALEDYKGKWDLRKVGAQAASNKELEQMRIDAGKYKKASTTALSFWDAIRSGKLTNEKAAVMMEGYAMNSEDPTEAAKYMEHAKKFAEEARRLKDPTSSSKPNLDALGIETNPDTVPYSGTPAAKPKGTGTAADPIVLN